MIDTLIRAITGELPVPVVIVLCWLSLAAGALLWRDEPKPKPKPPAAEPGTEEFPAVDTDPATYGRHAPPTEPLASELIGPLRDVVVRVPTARFPRVEPTTSRIDVRV